MNPRQLLRRAEATQRLQSGDRLPGRGMVAHPGRDPGLPFFEIPNGVVKVVILLIIVGFRRVAAIALPKATAL